MGAQRIARRRGYDGARMRRVAPFLLFSALLCALPGTAGAQDTPSVLVAKVDGSIDRTLASYLVGSVEVGRTHGGRRSCCSSTARGRWTRTPVALAERIHDASVP